MGKTSPSDSYCGIGLVDASVTRGVKGAHQGKLAFFIGGEDAHVQIVEPYLKAMGRSQFHFGPVGNGHAAKILNNMISLSTLALIGEAIYLASEKGLNIDLFLKAVMAGNGRSGTIEILGPRLVAKEFETVNFRLCLAIKDMALSQQMAAEADRPFLVSAAAHKAYQFAGMLGLSDKDVITIANIWSS